MWSLNPFLNVHHKNGKLKIVFSIISYKKKLSQSKKYAQYDLSATKKLEIG